MEIGFAGVPPVVDIAREQTKQKIIIFTSIAAFWLASMYWCIHASRDPYDFKVCVGTMTTYALGAAAMVYIYFAYLPWLGSDEDFEMLEEPTPDPMDVIASSRQMSQPYVNRRNVS